MESLAPPLLTALMHNPLLTPQYWASECEHTCTHTLACIHTNLQEWTFLSQGNKVLKAILPLWEIKIGRGCRDEATAKRPQRNNPIPIMFALAGFHGDGRRHSLSCRSSPIPFREEHIGLKTQMLLGNVFHYWVLVLFVQQNSQYALRSCACTCSGGRKLPQPRRCSCESLNQLVKEWTDIDVPLSKTWVHVSVIISTFL